MGARVTLLFVILAACGKPPARESSKFEASGDDSATVPEGKMPAGKKAATGTLSGPTAGTDTVEPLPPPPVQDGSWQHPFIIDSFPGTLNNDTKKSTVSVVKSYACDPTEGEAGPEHVYKLTAPADGTFTVTLPEVSGDGIEIDLYLLTGTSGNNCVQAGNADITQAMKAGETYYLSLDSWSNSSGETFPGVYNATVTFTPVGTTGCPADMQSVPFQSGVCMDKYEAPNVQGQKPLVMFSMDESEAWCQAKGKRLCFDDEWTFACATAAQNPYPWGIVYEENTCNADKTWKAYSQDRLNAWPTGINTPATATLDALITAAKNKGATAADSATHVMDLYQAEPAGGFPGCTNVFGVRDLYGGVEEWTKRRDGGQPNFHGNLKGRFWATKDPNRTCQTNVKVHADPFRFYEIGFRCCKSK